MEMKGGIEMHVNCFAFCCCFLFEILGSYKQQIRTGVHTRLEM